MPCPNCDSPRLISREYENMRCPECSNLSIIELQRLEPLIKDVRDIFSDERVMDLYKQYSKTHLILALIRSANKAGHGIYTNRMSSIRDLSIASQLVKRIYPKTGFGDDQMQISDGNPERLDTLLSHQSILKELDHLESKFKYAYPYQGEDLKASSEFFKQFYRYQSEWEYCYLRCSKSLHGGFEENKTLFDKACKNFRNFDTPSADNIQTAEDFAKTFFEFIISMAFMYSADESLDDVYQHSFHDALTINKLTALTERLDNQFSRHTRAQIDQSGELAVVDWIEFQEIGYDLFDEDWPDVREQILMRPGNTDAHPFLFEIAVETPVPGFRPGKPLYLDMPKVVYPRHYSKLIRMQMFPMLKTSNGTAGHNILKNVACKRGPVFERNLHEYLVNEGYESYHSAEASKSNQHEVDVLVVEEDKEEIWFIECKYLLPPVRMDTPDGIQDMNEEKFDERVFPTGSIAFDDKADWWMETQPGDEFTSQVGKGKDDRTRQRFAKEWEDYDVQKYVVSNLAPSYPIKRGVLFFTGPEFIRFLDTGKTLYLPKRHPE